jgi:hypothetical protein
MKQESQRLLESNAENVVNYRTAPFHMLVCDMIQTFAQELNTFTLNFTYTLCSQQLTYQKTLEQQQRESERLRP